VARKFLSSLDMGLQKIINVLTPSASTDAATKGYVDSGPGIGRMGTLQDTSAAQVITSASGEVKIGQISFTAVAGRRYEVRASGVLNNDTGNAVMYRVRWVAGATVTVANGAIILEVPCCTTQGFGQQVYGMIEEPGVFTAGTVSVGLFALTNAGSGNSRWGDGSVRPSVLTVRDIGT
jgi:hypothetical protein